MTSKRLAIVPIVLGLLLIAMTPMRVSADVTGNTYYYSVNWLAQTVQEDGGPIFVSNVDGQFRITVFNVTQQHGDDVINFNYQGFNWYLLPFSEDYNGTVDFQDNKVYWDLSTDDEDENGLSSDTDMDIYPMISHAHPGRFLFVNPVWSTHNTNWDSAVNETDNDTTATLVSESAGEGSFSFRIEVAVEDTENELEGTYTYTFSANYDEDGVLTDLDFTTRMLMTNEASTQDYTIGVQVLRTGGSGPTGGISLGSGVPTLVVVAALPIVLLVGMGIGKKMWG